jgi:hypothetical protein
MWGHNSISQFCENHFFTWAKESSEDLCAPNLHRNSIFWLCKKEIMQLPLLFPLNKKNEAPMTQLDAFIHFFQLMDLEMLDLILERRAYMDLPKSVFINRLGRAFEILRSMSDDKLFETYITNYRKGNNHYVDREIEFVGNHSSQRISLVVAAWKGEIRDIRDNNNLPSTNLSKPNKKIILLGSL